MKILLLLTIVLQSYQFQLKNKRPIPSIVSITIDDVITINTEYKQVYRIQSIEEMGELLVIDAIDEQNYPCLITVAEDIIEVRYSKKLWFKYWVREL